MDEGLRTVATVKRAVWKFAATQRGGLGQLLFVCDDHVWFDEAKLTERNVAIVCGEAYDGPNDCDLCSSANSR